MCKHFSSKSRLWNVLPHSFIFSFQLLKVRSRCCCCCCYYLAHYWPVFRKFCLSHLKGCSYVYNSVLTKYSFLLSFQTGYKFCRRKHPPPDQLLCAPAQHMRRSTQPSGLAALLLPGFWDLTANTFIYWATVQALNMYSWPKEKLVKAVPQNSWLKVGVKKAGGRGEGYGSAERPQLGDTCLLVTSLQQGSLCKSTLRCPLSRSLGRKRESKKERVLF